jgi:hypothetical protein
MAKRRTVVESPKGNCQLQLSDGRKISARYSLEVSVTLGYKPRTGGIVSWTDTVGTIEVSPDEPRVDLSGRAITLIMDDARCLEAWIKSGDSESRHWEIVAAGRQGPEPC